jgi:hypothetical protein
MGIAIIIITQIIEIPIFSIKYTAIKLGNKMGNMINAKILSKNFFRLFLLSLREEKSILPSLLYLFSKKIIGLNEKKGM